MRALRFPLLAVLALLPLVAAACGSSSTTGTPFTIGLTYVPNIQFAPFYVADNLGYYKAAGLNVTLRHHALAEDEFGALVSGQEDGIIAGGDEILLARDKGIAVTYLAPIYSTYPVVLIVPANSPIQSAANLRGHTIGIPGPFGATYIGLLVLLQQAGLKTSDVTIQNIGFTQAEALLTHKVDAVMGYLNNEAVILQQQNFAVRTIPVFPNPSTSFYSNGLATLSKSLTDHPAAVRAFIAATLRGVTYVDQHPDDALRISSMARYANITASQQANAKAVLAATIPLWQNAGQPMSTDNWQVMINFMHANGLLTQALNPADCFSNDYLPASS